MPKVSVVVPVYNLEFYIDRCLNSLAEQTCKDIEVLVVNDGGSDDSQIIIDEYVSKYPEIFKSYYKENGGHGSACNFGIDRATSDYLMIVDGDDYLDPTTIEFMYDQARSTGADLLIGNLMYCYTGHTAPFKPLPADDGQEIAGSDRDLLYKNWATPCGRLYSMEIFADPDLRLREGIIFADANFVPKSYLAAKKIYYVDKELYNYDLTRPTQSMKQTDKRILNIVPALTDMLEFYKKKEKFEECEVQLMWYVARHCVAWIQKVKLLTNYSRIDALHEIFAVPDQYFGEKWLHTGIVAESFGRRVEVGLKIARFFRYYPIIWFWALSQQIKRCDYIIEKILAFPLRAYQALKRRVRARLINILN